MSKFSAHNAKVCDKFVSEIEFESDIRFRLFYNNLSYSIMEYCRNTNFGWNDDTYNLRASIGVGIYSNKEGGKLVTWKGEGFPDVNPTFRNSQKYHKHNYPDGNEARKRVIGEVQSNLGSDYSLRVFIGVPYGFYIDHNNYAGSGWISDLEDGIESLIQKEWAQFEHSFVTWRKKL